MWKRLRQTISRAGELLGLIAAKKERDQEDSRRSAARARFWADLREGQREAQAQCVKQKHTA